jgi:hypothetical protein
MPDFLLSGIWSVQYRIKGTQSFTEMPQCLTEMSDTEIPMPAASALMHQQN